MGRFGVRRPPLAGKGFKRQVPVGPHITDLVSFPLRLVIELVPGDESIEARQTRNARCAWLIERNYRVVEVAEPDVEADIGKVLDHLANSATSS